MKKSNLWLFSVSNFNTFVIKKTKKGNWFVYDEDRVNPVRFRLKVLNPSAVEGKTIKGNFLLINAAGKIVQEGRITAHLESIQKDKATVVELLTSGIRLVVMMEGKEV